MFVRIKEKQKLKTEVLMLGIAFWNGESKGTEYTINKMKKLGKEVIVVRMGV